MTPRRAKAVKAPAAASDAAADIVHALTLAMRRRSDARSERALAWFHTPAGSPTVDVEERPVGAFVARRWPSVRALVKRRDTPVRQAAVWALSLVPDARLAPVLVDLLLHQHDECDHDFAYEAARRLGARGVPAFERLALRGKGLARTHAIECIGCSRAGKHAVRAMARIVDRIGFVDGVATALCNLHCADALSLAVRALDTPEPDARSEALMAVLSCLEATAAPHRVRGREDLVHRVIGLFADERVWTEPGDPWASTFGWGLDVLVLLRSSAARSFAERALRTGDADRRDSARDAMRRLPR